MNVKHKERVLREMQRARALSGLSQEALSEALNVCRQYVTNLETGRQRFFLDTALLYVDTLAKHGVPKSQIPSLDDLALLP